ncbi:MAG TPA: ROK family protein [Candidatus Sulfotelmatobacter sp.]|nr:ROK family protein [Candidatus Sulfotelmatobacter sp.]
MYLAIDIGGTKTFVAALDENGVIKQLIKIATDESYKKFLSRLEGAIDALGVDKYIACGAGIPATSFDSKKGIAHAFGNIPWKDVEIRKDFQRITKCPVFLTNDAKMAALSESMLLKDKYSRVLYVTISTGLGFGLVVDGEIDYDIGDEGGTTIMLEHKGRIEAWEDFASGKAIVKRFGKKAKDITDEATWKIISHDIAQGMVHLIAITAPEVIVIGGSVGNYFDRYSKFLREEIEKYRMPILKIPAIMKAQRPDEAVVYGCYDLAKQLSNAKTN